MTKKTKISWPSQKISQGNRLLSLNVILSISLALFIFGLCGLLLSYAQQMAYLVKNNFEIQVFLQKNLSKDDMISIRQKIADKNYLSPGKARLPNIEYISAEEAKKDFIRKTGEDFTNILEDNPLRASFVVKIKPDYYEAKKLKVIRKDLESLPGVFEVSFVEDLINVINRNMATIGFFLMIFGVFVLITVVILIDNTIKIALFSHRFIIRSMQLVGATDAFIQKPFITQSAIRGSISGLMAGVLLFLFTQYLQIQLPDLRILHRVEVILSLIFFLIVLGALIGGLSAFRSVRKYLHSSLDNLY